MLIRVGLMFGPRGSQAVPSLVNSSHGTRSPVSTFPHTDAS
jgi:hypothetical protein